MIILVGCRFDYEIIIGNSSRLVLIFMGLGWYGLSKQDPRQTPLKSEMVDGPVS